jgi:hypothetical protein
MKTNVWEIVRTEDGTFEMFHNGVLLHSSIPDRWLEGQLARYGFCGEEYRDIRRELAQLGRAKIAL